MSRLITLCVFLAVAFCFCEAQVSGRGEQCLCQIVRNRLKGSVIKSMQIYEATNFCSKKEIIVTMENNFRYCLDPNLPRVRNFVNAFMTSKPSKATPKATLTTTLSSETTSQL